MFQITVSFAESVRVECLGQCHNISNKEGRGHLTLNRNLWNRAHFHLFIVAYYLCFTVLHYFSLHLFMVWHKGSNNDY